MVRWGVAGPGAIAVGFADAMEQVEGGEIVAVASRSNERANAFADRFGVRYRYGDYDDLADAPEVDVVYVATPQSRHASDTLRMIEGGKHVLCEKPFALTADQARDMAGAARARGLFLMEAMWSRFLPAYQVLTGAICEGTIGDPLLVEGDFGFRREIDPHDRLFRLELGGGGLLDLGIYPIQLCTLVLGSVEHVAAEGLIGTTGVDEQVAAVLRHRGGLGVVKAALRSSMTCSARIAGSDGVIGLPALMHCPTSITIASAAGIKEVDATFPGNGLQFEIDEVHRCLATGTTESLVMSLEETIAIAGVLDLIRAQIGLVFPDE